MIRLTERAAYALREILRSHKAPREEGVKLVPAESGGVTMTIDQAQVGDTIVDGGKRPLLIVDSSLATRLDGVVLDITPENGEKRFILAKTTA